MSNYHHYINTTRTYHFESEDGEYLDGWISSLNTDRYYNILEERNAYQQMQSELTGKLI